MKKITPNPPETPTLSAHGALDSTKLHKAAERALDYHLTPPSDNPKLDKRPSTIFAVAPDVDTETLLIHACETLASLNVMSTDQAFELGRLTPQRGAGDSANSRAGRVVGE